MSIGIRALAVMIAIPLTGCIDDIGPRGDCSAEMRQVRQQHGLPDRTESGRHSELWVYGVPPTGIYYEFDWSSGERCTVTGPLSQSRLAANGALLDRERPAQVSMS